MATVKVSDRTYKELNEIAGKMRTRLRRPVSVDEAIEFAMRRDRMRPSDYAGALVMTDEELAGISKGMRKFWSSWKFQSE